MQQIERYGVIALVFLLVTIVAVSFWGDKKSPGFWARLTGRNAAQKQVGSVAPELARTEFSATERAVENAMPLSTQATVLANDPAGASAPQALAIESSGVATLDASHNALPQAAEHATSTPVSGPLVAHEAEGLPPAASGRLLTSNAREDDSSSVRSSPSAPSALGTGTTRVYTVQKGDSLGGIARKTLGQSSRWPEIQALNSGVEPKSLRVGMKLALPASAKVSTSSETSTKAADVAKRSPESKKASTEKRDSRTRPSSPDVAPAQSASGKTYVVRAGDSLHQIAEQRLGDGRRWQEIVKLNPGLDPKRLHVGQSLTLPAASARALVAQAAVPSSASSSTKPRVR